MISQNGIPVTNGVQQAVGPHWGHVKGFALPRRQRCRRADRSRAAAAPAATPATPRTRTQAVEVIRDEQPARRRRRRDDRHLARRRWAATRSAPTTARARGQPGHRRSRTRRTSCNAGDYARVLTEFWADGPKSETPPGHWNVIANEVSDELDPDLRVGGTGSTGRPPAVGRQAVPRAQRRGARRGDRRVGPQGPLRLRPPDLDDPLHGRARPVERPGAARRTTPRASRSSPGWSELDHRRDDRRRAAPRRARRARGRDRHPRLGGQPGGPRRPRPAVSAGSSPSTGSRTSCRRSSRRRSRATCPGTARSAAPPPR